MNQADKKIQEQFSARAPIYDGSANWISDHGLLQAIVKACRAPASAHLLDVCCGTGRVGEAFAGRVARRVGLDLTEDMLEVARTRLDEVVQGSADRMPFADASFDVVTCRQALHFVDDPDRVLSEMHRVLRVGGQVIVAHRVPHGAADAAWWESVNRKKQPLIRNLLQDRDVVALVEKAGFGAVSVDNFLLWESIPHWLDSPEARQASEEIFTLYRQAPPEAAEARGIQITDTEIRDRWRWIIVSGQR